MRHISVSETKALREEAGRDIVLLDCREPWELEVASIEGAVSIPMSEFVGRIAELDAEAEIIVLCHHGMRSQSVAAYLEEQGFSVEVCANGDDAYAIARVHSFDAILLDIMLPGRDGLSVLRLLRQGGNEVPIIIITARGDVTERIEGLNLGADDYIAKPFYIDELLARLRSIWRRASGNGLSVLCVGDLSINLMTREVMRNEVSIDLTAREFALLEFLMRSPGRVLTRIQIFEHVWNYHFHPKTNLVDVYIQKLRRKIDDSIEEGLIRTVRGVGYCIKSER